MNAFALTEDQDRHPRHGGDFAAEALAPYAARWDEEKHFPVEEMRAAAALGMGGIYIRRGCRRLGTVATRRSALIFEALLDRLPDGRGLYLDPQHVRLDDRPLRLGRAAPSAFLPKLCTMEHLLSHCLTEPGAGSDAAALKTKAVLDGDHYVLDGRSSSSREPASPTSMS